MSTATITNKDRFSFALFLAVTLHAALILGIGFSVDANNAENSTIEVTLSLANDVLAPDDADFIASTNQQGGGSGDVAQEMTTTEQTDFQSNEFAEVLMQQAPTEQVLENQQEILSTTETAIEQINRELLEPTELIETPNAAQLDRTKLVQEIASLEARIAQDQQAIAKMSRTKRLSSVSTRSASEAAYLNMWREKCERIGRVNYPAGNLEGEVLILVSILSDGTLEEVRLLNSSGHRALDQAALTTVRQAAPFQPFNVEMRKAYDRFEFTRTWQFTKGGSAFGS